MPMDHAPRCPQCGARLQIRMARVTGDPYVVCDDYPECSYERFYDADLRRISARNASTWSSRRDGGPAKQSTV